jgi:hypothetical protein
VTLLYASTFADALGRLTHNEQKQVKLTTVDLMLDPRGNGLQMHRVEKSEGFWTVRVSQDIRIVVHKSDDDVLLAYVGHHDDAYRWAERKRLVPHERTGAMQFVEIPVVDAVPSVASPEPTAVLIGSPEPAPSFSVVRPFAALSDDQLLDVGVPRDWLEAVRETVEDELFILFDKLPAEAAEALLDHATGGRIEDHVAVVAPTVSPFAHPDAQRRFRLVENIEELKAALDQPFEKWAVFLHPTQRELVERDWSGPARVSGSAGTGKTIVALHRAVHLARNDPAAKVLLTTFSKPLAVALAAKRDVLTEAEPVIRSRVQVSTLDQAAHELFTTRFGPVNMATASQVRNAIGKARDAGLGGTFTSDFLFEEWEELVDAWHVTDADLYAEVPRLGRKMRLGARQREAAWAVYEFVRMRLAERKLTTWPQLYARLAEWLRESGPLPWTHVVVDESQDLSVAQVRFLAAAGADRPGALFLTGDIGQRIFHLPFSWVRLGLDIRGRSHRLKVNYRTSHQIRSAADRLLPGSITDLDGEEEGRRGTVSVFDGPAPSLILVAGELEEEQAVAHFLRHCRGEGIDAPQIAVLVRGPGQLGRARSAVKASGEDPRAPDGIAIRTMHDAKGLEFRAVAVMACDEDVLPDPARLAGIGDMGDMEAAYETERHLLYVACTRARDRLLVTGVAPGSEFLDDLRERV